MCQVVWAERGKKQAERRATISPVSPINSSYDLSQKRRNLQQRQLRWAANIYHYYIIMPVDIDTLSKSLEGRFI